MQPGVLCPCRGAPLVLTSVSGEQQHCYAVQVEAAIMAVEFLSCPHHKKESLCFPRSSHTHTLPVRSLSSAAETGGDVLSHALMSCWRRRCCSHVPASSWELFWKGKNSSLQLPRTKSLTQTFPLNWLAVTPVVSLSLKGFSCTCS